MEDYVLVIGYCGLIEWLWFDNQCGPSYRDRLYMSICLSAWWFPAAPWDVRVWLQNRSQRWGFDQMFFLRWCRYERKTGREKKGKERFILSFCKHILLQPYYSFILKPAEQKSCSRSFFFLHYSPCLLTWPVSRTDVLFFKQCGPHGTSFSLH